MKHDSMCNYLLSVVPAEDCPVCFLINRIRRDERDILRSHVDGVYRITGDGLIRTVLDYINKRDEIK